MKKKYYATSIRWKIMPKYLRIVFIFGFLFSLGFGFLSSGSSDFILVIAHAVGSVGAALLFAAVPALILKVFLKKQFEYIFETTLAWFFLFIPLIALFGAIVNSTY